MIRSSESSVIASPLSFTGSALRIWRITSISNSLVIKWVVLAPFAMGFILVAWSFVAAWYMIFGLWLVPYRLIRRGQRKEKRDKLRHREILENLERRG